MSLIRVVVVDDHPSVRAGLCAMLSKMPDILIQGEAGDGHEALRMAQTLQPDVLLLDMELPGLKGTEIAQRLRQQRSPVRILGISAHDDEGYIFGLLMQGAAGYMTKDDALTAIGEAVRGVARGEVGWFSRRVMAKVMQRNFGEAAVTPPDQTVVLSLRERQVLQLVAQ